MKRYYHVYCLLLPFLISIIVYLNCLQNSFVYDDDSTIINNYFIRHWSNLPDLFTSRYFVLSAELTYRPVVTLSYFIDYTFWHLNPLGYHLTNILLHATNSVLVFIFGFQIFKRRSATLISALFFSSYPLFSEVVNAVGFREDLLAFMFLILAFICYLKANQQRYILYYPMSLFCYFLSLFSKEMAITLPVLIILYDMVFKGTPYQKARYLYYLGYFFVAIFYMLNRFFFLHNPLESQIPYPQGSLFVNFLTMTHVLASYVKLLFLPFHLNADYVVPFSTSLAKTSFWLAVLLFVAIGICSFRMRFQNRRIFFFMLWFFVTLIPVMNIIPLGNIMAERFLYIPGAGFSMIVACLLSKMHSKYSIASSNHIIPNISDDFAGRIIAPYPSLSIPFVFIVFFILFGNAYLTCKRNNDWKDGLWLWSKTTLTSPNSFRAHINLGNAYEKKGLNTAAFEEYQRALSIDPNDADIYNNLGIYYNKMNHFDDAIQHFIRCLNINPKHPRAYNNLGVVFTKQRRLDEAIQVFRQAISINPLYPDAHNNLGIACYRKGLIDEAEREFKLAISIEPYHAEAHNDLGILYNDRHLFADAIREFETAVQIKPNYANAHMNLGAVILKHRKNKEKALFHLKESVKIEPQQEQAAGINKLIEQLEHAIKQITP
ncbi:MAG TPA: tetratricopeptide repeat protein [Candidatus Wunengus sp. YC60]|uniref:tetratricopeptide repeat protein n=1 Tax=Candidatus Wunengus sp. YC60 TaxID=3367697 RepID=UPI0040299DF9